MRFPFKLILFIIIFLFNLKNINAQSASAIAYSFTVTPPSPAIPAFPTVGNLNFFTNAVPLDEWDSLTAPPGFNFTFGGVVYSKIVVSSNGWIALCPATTAALPSVFVGNAMPNNLLSNNTTGFPIIAPLWDDLSAAVITWNVNAANIVWFRWTGRWQKTNQSGIASLFYLKLDGNNNTINFYYSNTVTYTPANPSASIGIAGVCPGDFYSCSPTSSSMATVDDVNENTNVGQNFPTGFRPFNTQYTFTPVAVHPNDACASAQSMGTISSTCTTTVASTYNATPSGLSGNCGSSDVKDVWFSFIKPAGMNDVQFTTSPVSTCSATGTKMEVYLGCPGGAPLACSTTSAANPNFAEVTVSRPFCTAETLLVRVTANGDVAGKFNICSKNLTPFTGVACNTAIPICFPLPYTTSGTTSGSINNYNDSTVCQSAWMTGQDIVYSFTPLVSSCFNFSLSGTGFNSYPGLHIFDGCPDDTALTTCVASSQTQSNSGSINNITLQGGHVYYILIDNNATLAGVDWIDYTLNISNSVTAAPAYDNCGTQSGNLGLINGSTSCNFGPIFNLQCATPSPISVPNPVCGGIVPALTPDVWFSFQPTFAGSIQISTQGASANPAQHLGIAIYTGNCNSLTLVTCAGDSTGIVFLPSVTFAVTNQIYYVRIWSATYGNPGAFQLCLEGNCAPPNDLPINAIALPLATPAFGDNTCSTGANEMANPINCPTGTVNTVWYKVIVPASGNVAVRISQVSLLDASVAAFTFLSGPANATTTFTRLACNDDIVFAAPCPICGMYGDGDAAIQFTAQPGSTVYIAVDGEGGLVGSFWITAIDGNFMSTFPPIIRKDCANPELICDNKNYSCPNGGIGSNGNICDFMHLACSSGGDIDEAGSTWLQFTVAAGSTLGFTITPNDSAAPVANYNFLLWDKTSVPNICDLLGTTSPVRCNLVVGTGKTGLRSPATGQFAETIPATTSKTYLLYVQNITSANDDEGAPGTNTGFTLDWTIYTGGAPSGTTILIGAFCGCNSQQSVNDSNLCTIDGCDSITGTATHQPVSIDDNNKCTLDACDPSTGIVSHIPVNINDNNLCTIDLCNTLTGNITHTLFNTNDNNACTNDICDPASGIITHDLIIVDDGVSCTSDGCDSVTGIYHDTLPEICANGVDDNCDGQIDENCNVALHLKLFIEGYYLGNGQMVAAIDPNLYPLISDTVTVELRGSVYPYNVMYFERSLIGTNGNGIFSFPIAAINNSYYLVVHHRNALETWSSAPVLFAGLTVNYDFTNAINKSFGNNLNDLGDGNFAIWSGDISHASLGVGYQDEIIESQDYLDMENAVNAILIGYVPQDITGDGVVESMDYIIEENNVMGIIFTIRP